jgi:hypothetical protein
MKGHPYYCKECPSVNGLPYYFNDDDFHCRKFWIETNYNEDRIQKVNIMMPSIGYYIYAAELIDHFPEYCATYIHSIIGNKYLMGFNYCMDVLSIPPEQLEDKIKTMITFS